MVPETAPKATKKRSDTPRTPPETPQDPQGIAKGAPRIPKDTPNDPKGFPKGSQRVPKGAPKDPKAPQSTPKKCIDLNLHRLLVVLIHFHWGGGIGRRPVQ